MLHAMKNVVEAQKEDGTRLPLLVMGGGTEELARAVDNNTRAIEKTQLSLSDAFSPTKSYVAGDYAIYNNELYKCLTASTGVTPEGASSWEKVKVMNELSKTKEESISVINSITVINAFVKRQNNVCELYIAGTAKEQISAWTLLTTNLPTEFRPKKDISDSFAVFVNNALCYGNITANGAVNISQAIPSGGKLRMHMMYIL